jgi:hypothetical protein
MLHDQSAFEGRTLHSSRVTIQGCYVWYSPSLQNALRAVFPKSSGFILKIGRSDDIVSRHLEACELDTWRSTHPVKGFEPYAYAGIHDWRLYRYTTNLNGLTLDEREKELQRRHSPIHEMVWGAVYEHVSKRRYGAPSQTEIFKTSIDQSLRDDFPISYPGAHSDFILEAESLLGDTPF